MTSFSNISIVSRHKPVTEFLRLSFLSQAKKTLEEEKAKNANREKAEEVRNCSLLSP